jgi:osmotically-inducible protein OsmY
MRNILAKTRTTDEIDAALKNDVLSELKYEPSVKATDIGVLVNDCTVTLNGFATSYWEKWGAVAAARRVAGVRAIADDIEVRLPNSCHRSDGDIATAAATQIEWSTSLPADAVKITVREGFITLEGALEWQYQKDEAETAVERLMGVKGVVNIIAIKPGVSSSDIKNSILSALKRSALLASRKIEVDVAGHCVTLKGDVHNNAECDEAGRIAWAAPGVSSVNNQISTVWSWL